jgi:hypothetical protein
MKQFLKTALLILILVLFSATESIAQDKITLNNGTTISGDIVLMDTIEIKLKYYPQIDKTRWVLRTFKVKTIKMISYNDFEYNLDKADIENLIEIFNKKKNAKGSKPQTINKEKMLVIIE